MTGHPETPSAPHPAPRDAAAPPAPWVGRTLLLVALAVVGIGVVVVLYDRGWLPVAGIFVAMIVGPLVVYLRRLWLARRLRRLRLRLDEQLASLASSDLAAGAAAARRHLAVGDDHAAAHDVETLLRTGSGAAASDTAWQRQSAEVATTAGELRRTRGRVDAQLGRR